MWKSMGKQGAGETVYPAGEAWGGVGWGLWLNDSALESLYMGVSPSEFSGVSFGAFSLSTTTTILKLCIAMTHLALYVGLQSDAHCCTLVLLGATGGCSRM